MVVVGAYAEVVVVVDVAVAVVAVVLLGNRWYRYIVGSGVRI